MKFHIISSNTEAISKIYTEEELSDRILDVQLQKLDKKKRKPREKKKRQQNFVLGRWTISETLCYVRFLEENFIEFKEGGQSRRLKKTFVRMANIIKTRDTDQCRSHHQKMLNFRKSIPQIISYFKEKHKDLVDWEVPHNSLLNKSECPHNYLTEGCPEPHPFQVTVNKNCIRIEIQERLIKIYNPFS